MGQIVLGPRNPDVTVHIMPVYGTRPEAIKMAPVIAALDASDDLACTPAVTGQHRDMLDQVNRAFGIVPKFDLDIFAHGMSLSEVTEKTLNRLTPVLQSERPDAVLVQGDTTSALAAGLAAFYQKIPVIHLEAGLRTPSIASPFPEEGNRRLLSQITSLHLAPTAASRKNLLRFGVNATDIVVTGNTVIDALLATVSRDLPFTLSALTSLGHDSRKIVLVTSHRRESWGAPMTRTAQALATLASRRHDVLIVFPLHANPKVRAIFEPLLAPFDNVLLTDSLDYTDLCRVLALCTFVVSDSGGIQEEAPALGKPVLVLREDTERPEAVDAGTARLVGTDADLIVAEATRLLDDADAYTSMARARNPFGDGHASARAVAAIRALFNLGDRLADFNYDAAGAAGGPA